MVASPSRPQWTWFLPVNLSIRPWLFVAHSFVCVSVEDYEIAELLACPHGIELETQVDGVGTIVGQ